MRLVGRSNGETFKVRNQKILRSKEIFLIDLLDSAYGKESWKESIILVKTGLVSFLPVEWSGSTGHAFGDQSGWGPVCGDAVLCRLFGEECRFGLFAQNFKTTGRTGTVA